MARYMVAGRRFFRQADAGPHFSLVQDSTRMGGLDMHYSALYSSSLETAMWLPPMAGFLIYLSGPVPLSDARLAQKRVRG